MVFMIYSWYLFFFKQKTAYEMRISDWSSDVCSSDLRQAHAAEGVRVGIVGGAHGEAHEDVDVAARPLRPGLEVDDELLDRAVLLVERAQRRRHLREVAELEAHVAGMAGGGGPEVGVLGSETRRVGNECVR